MAATADPRAKPPAAPTTHHLEPWARQQQPQPRAHRVRVAAHHAVEDSGASADRDRRRSSSTHRTSSGGGIEDLRGKLMGHLPDAEDRLRVPQPSPPLPLTPKAASPPPPKTEEREIMAPPPPAQQQQEVRADVADKPWKLRERTRRRPAALTSWPTAPSPKASRRRKRAPFSVSLTAAEIEEDIYALTAGRPRRRPRKRTRAVQSKLDSLSPGMWLAEITADDYKVPDPDE